MAANKKSETDSRRSRFHLNITAKLLLGFLSGAIVIVILSAFSISTLEKLNKISISVVEVDVPTIETADNMIESLLAQELYGRRYAILGTSETLDLFWEKNNEFDKYTEKLEQLGLPVGHIITLHSEYSETFKEGIKYLSSPSSPKSREYEAMLKDKMDEMVSMMKDVLSDAKEKQRQKTVSTSAITESAARTAWILSFFAILLGLFFAIVITRNISGAVLRLKTATKHISEGKFEYISDVKNNDELGELAMLFNKMAKRLEQLEEMNIDASPLTRLPGGMAIEKVVQSRLDAGEKIAFCHLDIDNFKGYSDRYGYAKGSEAIKVVADVISEAVDDGTDNNDFVGHIGGDDYVLLTRPDRYEVTCNAVIERFDATIPDLYDEEDRKAGFIPGKTRHGDAINFPLMTISISVVLNDDGKISNPLEFGEVAAELKEKAKAIPKSVFVVDRRKKVFHQAENIEEERRRAGTS